jgi:hypothetical protein
VAVKFVLTREGIEEYRIARKRPISATEYFVILVLSVLFVPATLEEINIRTSRRYQTRIERESLKAIVKKTIDEGLVEAVEWED